MWSGRFRFVGGSHELQEPLAVLVDLHRSHAADLAERIWGLRSADGDLEQRPVWEDDVGRHLLVPGDLGAQRAQLLEQACIGGTRDELRRLGFGLGLSPLATSTTLLARLGGGGRPLAPRRVVSAKTVVATAAILSGCGITEVAQHEAAPAARRIC